jgi:hypothetical protein
MRYAEAPTDPSVLQALADTDTAMNVSTSDALSSAIGSHVSLQTFVRVIMEDLAEFGEKVPTTLLHSEALFQQYEESILQCEVNHMNKDIVSTENETNVQLSKSTHTNLLPDSISTSTDTAATSKNDTTANTATVTTSTTTVQPGNIPLSTLLHLLCEIDGPTALAADEASDLLRMTGVTAELRARETAAVIASGGNVDEQATITSLYSTNVNVKNLLQHMLFPFPKKNIPSNSTNALVTLSE